MRIKDNYRIIRRWIRTILFVICLIWFAGNVSEVHAQEYVLREAIGDLEALVGIEISDEQADEWSAEEKSQGSQDAQAGAQYPFLEYGSDYGDDPARARLSRGFGDYSASGVYADPGPEETY